MKGKSNTTDRKRAYQLLVAAVFLVFLTPYLSTRFSPATGLGVAAAVSLLAIGIIRSGATHFDWFHPLALFSIHFFLLFVANGVIILLGISHILTSVYGPAPETVFALMNRATLYASAFLLAVYAGFLFRSRRTGGQKGLEGASALQLVFHDSVRMRQLRVAAMLALVCSYAGCVILVVIFGGVGNIIGDPMAVIDSRGAFWPFVLVWASLWSFGVFYVSYTQERKPRYLAALFLTLPTMVFEFLTGGTKMAIILPVVCALMLRHYTVRRLKWTFVPQLAVFTLLLFVAGYSYRGPGGVGEFKQSVVEYAENKEFIFETFFGRFYGTDTFMVVLDAIDEGYPLQWGKTMSDLLYFYVPRVMWPDKPESYALDFGREFLGATARGAEGEATAKAGQTFFTPTMPGELYLNFGVIGLVVGGFLIGVILWQFYVSFVLRSHLSFVRILVYATLMPFLALLMSGPISTIVEYILLRCACVVMLYWFVRYAVRPRVRGVGSQTTVAL